MDLDESQRHRLVLSAFHALDHNKDGSINARDLLNVYADTFPSPEPGHAVLDEATANALISIASGDPQGGQDSPSISFQDFQHFLKTHRIEVIPTGKEWTRESLEVLLRDLAQLKARISDSLHQETASGNNNMMHRLRKACVCMCVMHVGRRRERWETGIVQFQDEDTPFFGMSQLPCSRSSTAHFHRMDCWAVFGQRWTATLPRQLAACYKE
ncbi:hypothetical protein B0O80DRAFT_288801 [Mortierella sp. GBAus27b]|nr:hypothetical protein B0O80DRAFT_288801 [Mortierella sp. GBAus27b]